MATRKRIDSFERWTIAARDGQTTAEIVPELGGIVSSFVAPVKGVPQETLFRHDWFWDRSSARTRGGVPFIFPICGRLERDGLDNTYLYKGRRYTMPPHGFASRMPWRVTGRNKADELTMAFTDTPATRAMYPFRFRLESRYRVVPGKLVCMQTYANTGDEPMPFYAGFHPYFLTPPPGKGKQATRLTFDAVRAFRYNEKLTDLMDLKPVPKTPQPVVSQELHELLVEVEGPAEATLLFPDGHKLVAGARGTQPTTLYPYLQFYTMEEKPFFCIEPWMSFPNALNTVAGVFWLAPGKKAKAVFECGIC